jgi:hypothetical protein
MRRCARLTRVALALATCGAGVAIPATVLAACGAAPASLTRGGPSSGAPRSSPVGAGRTVPVRFSVSLSQRTVTYGGPSVTLSIRMTTGVSQETVGLQALGPYWPDRAVRGSPLRMTDERVAGPGMITGHFSSTGTATVQGEQVCSRGAPSPEGSGVDLALPANSTSVLSYHIRLVSPPWPRTNYDPALLANIPASGNDVSYQHLRTPALSATAPGGMHITLSAGPYRRHNIFGAILVGRNRVVTMVGRTDPAIGAQTVQLRYQDTRSQRTGLFAVVHTDARGRFTSSWRPSRRGLYTIIATYVHPERGLTTDSNCDLAIEVG